jgi:signal transduction histidine kinase
VVVAGSGDDIEADVQVFGTKVSLTLAVFGLGLLLAVWFQVLVGLRPLYAMREALGDIRRGEAERLVGNYPREIEPLAHELNALLAHNAELLERARTQAANLAHALKNPLTVIRNEARQVEGEAAGVIREQALVMARSIDRYLPQARAAGSARSLGARADVHAILEDLRFSLERLYRDRNLHIQLNGLRGCRYRGEAEDLEEMLGNLLDNACKWARKRIKVHGECDGQGLSILIDDDGPGIPKQRLAEVLKRGQRLDETKPGSGLGLDIVQDIAGLYHGSLSLERSPTGGVRARLHLPAAPD